MSDRPTSGEFRIINALGLHARAAAKLVAAAKRFAADVWVGKDGEEVNGKSILAVMTLATPVGTTISLRCDGDDARDAFAALAELVRDGFGELAEDLP
ncbi:MAG: HPr family phosphocarrier protein [Myxococcota bacterium]